MSTKILIVDDHAVVLDGLELLLKQCSDLEVIAKAADANYGIAYLRKEKVDILLTDYNMGEQNGLELLKQAKKIQPQLKVIFLSMHDDENIVQEVIIAGADGFVLKKHASQEIIRAIELVSKGGQYFSPEVHKTFINALKNEEKEIELSEREVEILKLLVQELTSREIAERLFISERTIETHRKNMLRKTNSKNTIGLIKYAFTRGIINGSS